MSVLPSPIPHPLEYSPWDLPGWVYEALDWVIGVEWPEGNERAVWELADQWYALAAVLAGPHADAVIAASEVRNGYGGVGAVAEAFEIAWRRVAEGDEAPLPVLLAVSGDLGRLVEECGCDIEGAKLEVWIELGILVVELLALAVTTVLTAGAASPAAGAAITATRMVVQQIFKRLMGQLAKKALKQGLKEAGERAAKELAKDGVRGLARRAVREGLEEAGEEAGVSLATQAYQGSTGRRHGLDVADLGMSAVGGMAGGAVAPLAGLGRHATGRAARIGQHFGREMTGEVIAEQAASLATGQGLVSVEDVARAAASGATGSATGQTDTALHTRLDGRLSALAGASFVPSDLAGALQSDVKAGVPVTSDAGPASSPGHTGAAPVARHGSYLDAVLPTAATVHGDAAGSTVATAQVSVESGTPAPVALGDAGFAIRHGDLATAAAGIAPPDASSFAQPTTASVAIDTAATSDDMRAATSPTLSSITVESPPVQSMTAGGTGSSAVEPATNGNPATVGSPATGSPSTTGHGTPFAAAHGGSTSFVAPSPTTQSGAVAPGTGVGPTPRSGAGSSGDVPVVAPTPVNSRFPLLETLAPQPATLPADDARSPEPPVPPTTGSPRPRTPEWYAAKWAAEREGLDRRRYQGYFEAQRAWYEDRRRREWAAHLRMSAGAYLDRARWFKQRAREVDGAGLSLRAEHLFTASRVAEQDSYEISDRADGTLAGTVVPDEILIDSPADFRRINDDVADLAAGGVETGDRSALTGDDDPPPVDRSRRYGQWGGLRPPLALHQTDLERQMPRNPDGAVVRTADPREGGWFKLANDGGPQADPTRGINCLDCTVSLYDTWVHGRPRVSAPRTFDGYLQGDIRRPISGEAGGPGRVEDITGGRFQKLVPPREDLSPAEARHAVERGFRNLHDQLRVGGHGSYAFLITDWEHGGSHAWVALNQNGTVLYLDPQRGEIADRPLYTHCGEPDGGNVTGIDALIVGRDGRPMPLGGLARGRYSERPDLPDLPPTPDDESGYGDPHLNRMYVLDGPGAIPGPAHPARHDDGQPHDSDGVELSPDLQNQLSHEEQSILSSLRERAQAVADEVESALAAAGERAADALGLEHPVELRDQQFRVKSMNSLARKFLDEAAVFGVTAEDFSEEVNDVLRFSFAMPSGDRYGLAAEEILDELRRDGFSVTDGACKNFWRVGNRFYGLNCTLRSPSGQLFELQLHSDSSRAAWLHTHHAYEILRLPAESAQSRVHAFLRMLAVNRELGMPDQVPRELALRFPTKDATFAKWILQNATVWRDYLRWLDASGGNFVDVVKRFGLTVQDFPLSEELGARLEKADVDLLRALPKRRQG